MTFSDCASGQGEMTGWSQKDSGDGWRSTRLHRTQWAPLRKTLRGYWKLRVGDHRVVYKIEGEEVLILGIQHRKTVYEDIVQRLSRPR